MCHTHFNAGETALCHASGREPPHRPRRRLACHAGSGKAQPRPPSHAGRGGAHGGAAPPRHGRPWSLKLHGLQAEVLGLAHPSGLHRQTPPRPQDPGAV